MLSDDEVVIVEKEKLVETSCSAIDDLCQLCSANLRGQSATERDRHYSRHNSGEKTSVPRARRGRSRPTPMSTSRRRSTPMSMRSGMNKGNTASMDVFWDPTQAVAPPDNYAPGVLSVLKDALKKSCSKGSIRRALLCYERTPHIFHESFDATWGCGYRNFLMSCAALMDQQFQSIYSAHLSSPSAPGVRNLQQWIEDAWNQGYDDIGARELGNKLVDTKKKLGTGELYVAFTSRKIPCTLVDFDVRKSKKGFDTVVEWVVNYFKPEGDVNAVLRNESHVVVTDKMPIIMQYDGHSMTIVGYELGKNDKYNLLVFDPSSKVDKRIRQAALNVSASTHWTSPSATSLGKTKRHERSQSPAFKKRSRANEDFDGVANVTDSDEEGRNDAHRTTPLGSALDPDTVIKAFRLSKAKNKQEYQLLYFTMGDPLSEQEQNDRKVVLSIVGC